MPSIGLYHFTKKSNSTALPDPKNATWVTFTYKNDCSTHSPILLFEWGSKPDFTYAQIGSIYYFITDIVYVRQKLWQLELKEDCLGTFKDQIKSSTQFVDRTSTDYNGSIIDALPAIQWYPRKLVSTASMQFSSGCYVVGIVGIQGLRYYALTYAELNLVLNSLFATKQDDLWSTIVEVADAVQKNFINILSYVVSCTWIPYNLVGTKDDVYFGYWKSGLKAPVINPSNMNVIPPIDIAVAYNSDAHLGWTNSNQFRSIEVFIPGVGNIPIDANLVTNKLRVSFSVDIHGQIMGRILAQGLNESGELDWIRIHRFTGNVGVPVQITGSGTTNNMPLVAAVSNGASILRGSGNATTAINLGASIVNAEKNFTPVGMGSSQSFILSQEYPDIYVTTYYYYTTDQSPAVNGYPLMKQKTLSANGYYLILKPVVNFGNYYENQEITSMMEGGFYVE